jgi:hypothetical protein
MQIANANTNELEINPTICNLKTPKSANYKLHNKSTTLWKLHNISYTHIWTYWMGLINDHGVEKYKGTWRQPKGFDHCGPPNGREEVDGRVIKVKFKFLLDISHYCNNGFAFHMHMFIIFVLILNKINTTIHSNIWFMVIAYNLNLHFRIHCKNSKNKIIIDFIII